MRHLCVRSLREGERGIFSNYVCKQTLLIAFLSLIAAWREEKGLIPVSFTKRGEKMLFPREVTKAVIGERNVVWDVWWLVLQVLTTFPAGLIKRQKLLEVQSRASPAAVTTSRTQGTHTVFKLQVLKWCQVKSLLHFLTSSSSTELE